ncbi:DNA replication complex GINS protein PSF2 [Bienertia sinuspersici]
MEENLRKANYYYGPFRPQIATQVPLWLAVALKEEGSAQFDHTSGSQLVERLTQVLEAERDSPKEFQIEHLLRHLSYILFRPGLIEDIRDVRFHKVESGLETISARTHAVKVFFVSLRF